MDQIVALVFSWQILAFGVITALIIALFMKIGAAMWKRKKLRGVVRFFNALKPWVPWLIGGGLGAIPIWPRPAAVLALPAEEGAFWTPQYFSMILLGIVAGALYERIWKGVKQVIEARGIDIDLDLTPKEQKKAKGE